MGFGIIGDHADRLEELGLGFFQAALLGQGIGMFVDRCCCVGVMQSRFVGSAKGAQRDRQIDVR